MLKEYILNGDFGLREFEWAKSHGYDHRIRIDSSGKAFVIGDWSWNRNNPDRLECIEPMMERDGVYKC